MTRTLDKEISELRLNLMKLLNSWNVKSGKGLSPKPEAATPGMQLSNHKTLSHNCKKHKILKIIVEKLHS